MNSGELTDADGEKLETQHWIDEACDCQYLPPKPSGELLEELMQIGWMLNSMIAKTQSFCGQNSHMVRGDIIDYAVAADIDD